MTEPVDGELSLTEQLVFHCGYAAGYRAAKLEEDVEWQRQQAESPQLGKGPSFAEMEVLRWGPGGREHFADPRPGDYPGNRTEAA